MSRHLNNIFLIVKNSNKEFRMYVFIVLLTKQMLME
jgi:hypothetical protein